MPFYRSPYRRDRLQMTRQRFGSPAPNRLRETNNYFAPLNQLESTPYFNPYEQPPYGRVPTNVHTMMGHVGTITNGINMVRQMGGLMRLFR